MRTDIYSFHHRDGDFLVELHTSKQKGKKLGGELDQKAQERVHALVKILSTTGDPTTIRRVIVDQHWKKVQVIDDKGNKVTKTFSEVEQKLLGTKAPPLPQTLPPRFTTPVSSDATKDATAPVVETPAPILIASTSKERGIESVKAGLIEKGFHPITPMEKLWKLFNNFSLYIQGAAKQQNRSIGSYDFATHFFSKDATRKTLMKEELKSSHLLSKLCDFFVDNKMATQEVASIRKAAVWAKKIEDLRDKKRSTIVSQYESIAVDMHTSVKKLEKGQSLLIPFSSYSDAAGMRVESLRLLKITRQEDEKYTLEFIDSQENSPITGVSLDSLNLEDFFKPLVDMQLSASFFESSHFLVEAATRLFVQHPKMALWVMMNRAPQEERRIAQAVIEHAIETGMITKEFLSDRTDLTPEALVQEVFAPLLQTGSVDVRQAIFQVKPRMLATERVIDSFLPLVSQQEQAKIEAASLFQFYYLYQACLIDDPATMAVLEAGLNRVCELYEKLGMSEPSTNEMLRVIRTHIDRTKQQLHTRNISFDEKLSAPKLAETFVMNVPGSSHNLAALGSTLQPEESIEVPEPLVPRQVTRDIVLQEAINGEHLARADQIQVVLNEVEAAQEMLRQLHSLHDSSRPRFIDIHQQNLENLAQAVSTLDLGLDPNVARDIQKSLREFKKRIADPALSRESVMEHNKQYNQVLEVLEKKIRETVETEENLLRSGLVSEKVQIKDKVQSEIDRIGRERSEKRAQIIPKLQQLRGQYYYDSGAIDELIALIEKEPEGSLQRLVFDTSVFDYEINRLAREYDDISETQESLKRSLKEINDITLETSLRECKTLVLYSRMGDLCADIEPIKRYMQRRSDLGAFQSTIENHKPVISNLENNAIIATQATVTRQISEAQIKIQSMLNTLYQTGAIQQKLDIQTLIAPSSDQPHADFIAALNPLAAAVDPLITELRALRSAEVDKVRAVDHTGTLKKLEMRIKECKAQYKPPVEGKDRVFLQNEIRAIIQELPFANLDKSASFWAAMAGFEPQIKEIQKLLAVAYPDQQAKQQSSFKLQSALCDAVLFRMGKIGADKLCAHEAQLTDAFLRFNTPGEQKQLELFLQVLDQARVMVKQDVKSNYSNLRSATVFNGESFTLFPGAVLSPPSVTVQKTAIPFPTPSRNAAEYCGAMGLLLNYTQTIVDNEETSIRLNSNNQLGQLSADDLYKLFATNSSDANKGLLELFMHITSPHMIPMLDSRDENARLYLQLRQVIENRIMRPGHLEALFTDEDHVKAVLQALNGAIEIAATKSPFAYITLVSVKASVLLFLKEQHRLDEDKNQFQAYDAAVKDLLVAFDKKLKDDNFKDAKLQLHVCRLKIFAQMCACDPGITVQESEMSQLLDSWIAYKSASTVQDISQQDKDRIAQFFYQKMLPGWNGMPDKDAILTSILVLREQITSDTPLTWAREGEVYTTTLPSNQRCQIGFISGALSLNGAPLSISGDTLPEEVWEQFPFRRDSFKPLAPTIVPNTGANRVFQFTVDGLGQHVFQAEVSNAGISYSIEQDGVWFQYTPLVTVEDKRKEAAKRSDEPQSKLREIISFVQKVTSPFSALGQELRQLMLVDEEPRSVPQDIAARGIWINKQNANKGIVLSDHAENMYSVTLSHTRKKLEGKEVFASHITGVENSQKLRLVNTPQSSVYQHLSGLTHKDNIKIWADSKGQVRKIELHDPKMNFEWDPVSKKMMSQDLNGYYISEDQSLPVGEFTADWKNYLVVTNDTGERRVIMRQSSVLSQGFLTTQGFERAYAIGRDRPVADDNPGFIDVLLVEHPEKGYVLESNKPQANFYLGFAALQCDNFDSAVHYLRQAARSAPYSGVERDLIKALFEYKNTAFELFQPEGSAPPLKEGMSAFVEITKLMQKYERFTPSIAAAKLTALAVVLEQDLSKQPDLEKSLPEEAEVGRWLEFYSMPAVAGMPYEAVSEGCRLTPDELHRIFLQYPGLRNRQNTMDRFAAELTGFAPRESRSITPAEKSTKVAYQAVALHRIDSPLVKELSTSTQTNKTEKVMVFSAGSYIMRHFKEMYEQIDALDGSSDTGKAELEKIIQKLNRFKDKNPARKEAIDFLRKMALQKFYTDMGPGEIQKEATRVGFPNHIQALNKKRAEAMHACTEIMRLGKDLLLDAEYQELMRLQAELGKEIPLPDNWRDMSLADMQTESKKAHDGLQALTKKLSLQLTKSAKHHGVLVTSLKELESLESKPYRGYQEQVLSGKQVLEIHEWNTKGRRPPHPKALSKIKIDQQNSLADHMADPKKHPLPLGQTIESVLDKVIATGKEIQRLQESIKSKDADTWSIENQYKPMLQALLKGIVLKPPFRSQWERAELEAINVALGTLTEANQWVQKVPLCTGFPANRSDGYNAERILAFLQSHNEFPEYTLPETASAESVVKVEPLEPVSGQLLVEMGDITDAQSAKAVYEEAKRLIEEDSKNVVGYYRRENLAFFDQLTPDELFEMDGLLTSNFGSQLQALLREPDFTMRPNAFQLVKAFVAKSKMVTDTQDVASECLKLRAVIGARDIPKVAPEGTVKLVEKGLAIFDSQLTVAGKNSEKELETLVKATNSAYEKQQNEVQTIRYTILELANKLPENEAARSAEELRRIRGAAATISIEQVFRAYAKEDMQALKAKNTSLTDEDIQALTKLVTEHHLKATKLQILQRQVEYIQTAHDLRERFDALSFTDAIEGMKSSEIEAVIDGLTTRNLSLPEGYTVISLAEDIRDYMAVRESFDRNVTACRYYDPSNDHPHTRAALAYEYTLGVVFRDHQIKEFVARVGTPNIVSWLGTGFGKTFMAPGLAKMMATGTNLVVVVDTKDLIPTTSKTRDQDSREVYGQAAYHFQFERDPNRSVENLQQIEYRLLQCIANEGYLVTSKEALGSLVLQLLTWQRLSVDSHKYDAQIEIAQRIISLFRDQGVALGDEIHLILNIIEALDYAEGDRVSMSEYSEYYETTSSIYRCLYPLSTDTGVYAARSREIAGLLKIAENRQAQVNPVTVRDAMRLTASLIVDQSLDPNFKPKDAIHDLIKKLVQDQGVPKESLIAFLTISEEGKEVVHCPDAIMNLNKEDKRRIACLKENLSNTFEKVLKKIADDDFGVSDDKMGICPYYKGRPQPTKELDDVFQTIQTHYMWYTINGIPIDGLKSQIEQWKLGINNELPEYETVEQCPSYKMYRAVFGDKAPSIRDLDARKIEELALKSKSEPEIIHRFLELVVFPKKQLFPKKLGFNSMDLVSMFHKFGGYSGTIQTRSSFQRGVGVSNKDDPNVDAAAAKNFERVYANPNNQVQHVLKDLEAGAVAPLSSQLQDAGVAIKEFRAIIDVGGLFKELDYQDMAQDILNQFSPDELDAVLIYNDKSELVILRRGCDRVEPFDPKTVPPDPDKRFTVYRQPQITGSDIPQALRARALVTINEKTVWGDFEQGVGRLRKNKEGQTYAVVYRSSLMAKIDDDIKIAKAKGQEAEVARLEALKKGGKIDVQALTQHVEQAEIKQRRYFAAVAEMENIVKQPLRELLCTNDWRTVFKVFEDEFFEESMKTPDQLLEGKVPTAPTVILERHRARLIALIDAACPSVSESVAEILLQAKNELQGYTLPDPAAMPDTVVGTAGDSTKETEVNKETEQEVESERTTETERIQVEEMQSLGSGGVSPGWINWSPSNLCNWLHGEAMKGDGFSTYSLAKNGRELMQHLTTGISKKPFSIEYGALFPNISVTANMAQRRTGQFDFYGRMSPGSVSLLSKGQKICRSIAEISVEREGKREYHHLLLDVEDRAAFEESLKRARKILIEEFKEGLAPFAGKTLGALQSDSNFIALFGKGKGGMDDMQFLINLLGSEILAEDIASLSLRIHTEGRYTAACGALTLDDSDDASMEMLVRSKIIRGELSFTVREREILTRILSEDYLKLADYEKLKQDLVKKRVPEDQIARIIADKQRQGIRDYKELQNYERIIAEADLLDVFKLYTQAVRSTHPGQYIDINDRHFGVVVRGIMASIKKKET